MKQSETQCVRRANVTLPFAQEEDAFLIETLSDFYIFGKNPSCWLSMLRHTIPASYQIGIGSFMKSRLVTGIALGSAVMAVSTGGSAQSVSQTDLPNAKMTIVSDRTSDSSIAETSLDQTTAQGADNAPTRGAATDAPCGHKSDPYVSYNCLDTYLGTGVLERMANYYKLEWGKSGGPSDPNALPSRRPSWDPSPEASPPMPFTEWPYGGTTSLGVTRNSSVDSPLMVGLANTGLGKALTHSGIQIYGWVNAGINVSSNTVRPGGNLPISYAYTPNTIQLDQAVLYIERLPDTVQSDRVDWGFRIAPIYGANYRYTTSYGLFSNQLLGKNKVNGYDIPMYYGELFIPKVAEGLLIRVGRFISLPDIEAQLAPNNYMYTHSLTYTYDNYTNTGIQTTTALTKNVFLQLGISVGSDTAPWNVGKHIVNPMPNALYPNATFKKDPGAQPTYTACVRMTFNNGKDSFYPCADAINNGTWGYNNLQWYGFTYYHKFNEHWHVSYELYDLHQRDVPNKLNPEVQNIYASGGTPFSPQYVPNNAPNLAVCNNATVLKCTAKAIGTVAYINYSPNALNNFSFRPEFYSDAQGQRTGTKANYADFTIGWQHWFSPQLELRPEFGYWRAFGSAAPFNGGTKNFTLIGAADIIAHF